jgi:hypothetical protein
MDMMRLAARCPDQHHPPPGKVPGSDEPVLSVVAARVLNGDGAAGEHQSGISEVQPSMFQGGSSLFRAEADIHGIIVSHLLGESICVIQKSEEVALQGHHPRNATMAASLAFLRSRLLLPTDSSEARVGGRGRSQGAAASAGQPGTDARSCGLVRSPAQLGRASALAPDQDAPWTPTRVRHRDDHRYRLG